jgi:dolichyl-phosphate-mannose--protein O-mannosyl transferase
MDREEGCQMSFKMEINLKNPVSKIWSLVRKFNIGHLLLLAFALHMFAIASTPDSKIFDEIHYVSAAEATLNLQPANLEHTPLVKIMIAISIRVFGDWWFAWRFPIVLFGVASLFVFYLLAKRFMSERYALLATAFLTFDVMFFVHGSIYILDMPALFFGLLGIERYFAQKYAWCAVAFGLSFLCKELGLLFMFSVVLYHFVAKFRVEHTKVWSLKGLAKKSFATLLIASAAFLLVSGGGLWIYDAVYKPVVNPVVINNVHVNILQDVNGTPISTTTITDVSTMWSSINNPVEHLQYAWKYFTSLVPAVETPESDYRPPWGWVLPLTNIFNSPHYLTIAVTVGPVTHKTVDWVSQINPMISYAFVPLLFLCIIDFARRKGRAMDYLYLIWGLIAFMPWLIDQLVSRMTFNYYFLYTIPVICLGLGWGYSRLAPRIANRYVRYGLIFIHLAAVILFFMWFFPLQIFR